MTLDQLRRGQRAVVQQLDNTGAERGRLMDIGLVPGTEVEFGMDNPLRDPKAYLVRGSMIALRRHQTRAVRISLSLEEDT